MRYLLLVAVASIPTTATAMQTAEPQPLVFQVRFNEQVYAKPFTGQVLVLLSKRGGEPRFGPNWFNTEPFFSKEVKNWQPGTLLRIDATARGYPGTLDKLAPGTYTIQAVLDHELDRAIGTAAGNAFSKPVQRELNPRTSGPIDLQITEVIKPQTFHERENVKLVDIESKLLSAFHGRPVRLRAGVILPKSFAKQPEKRYPVIYDIPGFSGNHFFALFHGQNATDVAGVEMIYVHLDPDCPTGHHVFADSANNGPCGRALLEELIPHIEQRFRGIGKPTARFVTGHSSGGWSSLWLQVTYPDFFGGCWSTAPDPVDFRDFQRINIYKPGTNMFKDEQGRDRPLARRGDQPVLFYKPFSDMEEVTGHGGQLQSFEAVFSPKGPDGKPRKLWNRQTGAIDLEVAKAWEKYDIRLVLERNWPALAPRLQGKLHVYMGDKDTFYLEGATRLLKESLAKLGSDAKVELFPGKDHSTLVDSNLRRRIAQEMAQAFRQHHPEGK
jgi:pimeloyl-ACP methyl ester carboxylesterase